MSTKKKTYLANYLAGVAIRVESYEKRMADAATDLVKDPLHFFRWSESFYSDAARLALYKEFLKDCGSGVEAIVIGVVQDYIARLEATEFWQPRSTSMAANRVDDSIYEAKKEFLKELQRVLRNHAEEV